MVCSMSYGTRHIVGRIEQRALRGMRYGLWNEAYCR